MKISIQFVLGFLLFNLFSQGSLAEDKPPTLEYLEESEQVIITVIGEQKTVYNYKEDQRGFVSREGDWVGWDDEVGNWLCIPRGGERIRYDDEGNLISDKKKAPPSDAGEQAEEDPPVDVREFADILKSREDVKRAEFQLQPGLHQDDPDASMHTGYVEDQSQHLGETIDNIHSTVLGASAGIMGMKDLKDQIEGLKKSGNPPGAEYEYLEQGGYDPYADEYGDLSGDDYYGGGYIKNMGGENSYDDNDAGDDAEEGPSGISHVLITAPLLTLQKQKKLGKPPPQQMIELKQ